MSKIQTVRLINIGYNNNAIRISDECFHMNGESTLVSLRNGGGKSVLVQMMTAPFVHKRYRDAKDRPFESYFTTNKPSFILVEWALDQNAGYVLTGMMVRRSQDTSEGNNENLEMVNIISEYSGPCEQDIHNLPVVKKSKKEMTLKNFTDCRQMFEGYKKERSRKFFCYDMTNAAQSRQYFDKLMEYQIHYKEWETIIKKVNLKESGLSELFADCRDEKGLVEKWFLDAVESKLNKEKNRMKEFQDTLEKYVGQYKENKSSIKRYDTIQKFKEEAVKIRERAQEYQRAEEEKKEQENFVACFIAQLNRLHEETQEELKKTEESEEEVSEQIGHVEYERLSSDIHRLDKECRFHISNRDMLDSEKESLEHEAKRISKVICLLLCAKQGQALKEEEEELEYVRQRLRVVRKKEEDLEPERNELGYILRYWYELLAEKNQEKSLQNEKDCHKILEEIVKERVKISDLSQKLYENASKEGALKSNTLFYDEQEDEYNQRYEEGLARNILGEYDPGMLDIKLASYEKELEEKVRTRLAMRKQQESDREKKKSMERSLEDMRTGKIRKTAELSRQRQIREEYEGELESRRVILRYLNLEDDLLFGQDEILHVSERKLLEIDSVRRNLEKEEDILLKDYHRLTQGEVLELSEELKTGFEELGIHVVYGMEWLKKNGYKEKRNQELVKKNPFLPYALILSEQELEKLAGSRKELYTSSPIPIVLRERLEENRDADGGGVQMFPGVSFYVFFNENLLNEEKLRLLVQEKEHQIQKKQEAIQIRRTEYKEYFERQEQLRNQKVNKNLWDQSEKKIKALETEIKELERSLRTASGELLKLKEGIEKREQEIRSGEKEVERQKRRLEDFTKLCRDYESYEKSRKELEKCRREKEKLEEKQKLARNQEQKLLDVQRTKEAEKDGLFREQEELQRNIRKYERYKELPAEAEFMESNIDSIETEDMKEMEARYAAITTSMSQELQELEEQEQRAAKRCQNMSRELMQHQKKYGLDSKDWKGVIYSRKEEQHQESMLEDRQKKMEEKRRLWNEEDKKIALTLQRKNDRQKQMWEECGEEQPLPEEKIQNLDFAARKNKLIYEKKELRRQGEKLKERLKSYDENLTALSEYSNLPVIAEVEWEQDFAGMDHRRLRDFKGILIRDYNQRIKKRQEEKEQLTHVLNRIVRLEDFQEDFYRKPLESMLELTDEASQVLLQLSTTIQSYDSLMEKLRVDVSLVEREKNNIVGLLENYLEEVHKNLGKIDSNSTITIRNRPVKMLKILLPEWEENENLYRIHLQDMIDKVTQKGLELFEKNENAQEYFGIQITTKNLYDTVIGIGNVQIRLYKIEEQREYPITWAEVARNSGGEGFLSAFVILSSLLYYMRKDDTDIFADRNEGKVLIMDNPFAQTNAAHLLKPLMDVAKKTNTQMICLTGLSGESIYNRFDNIYVLNLIAANLRGGMQYLRADHLRGDDPETMVVSQIEVVEQQELVF